MTDSLARVVPDCQDTGYRWQIPPPPRHTGEEATLIWRFNNRENPYLFRGTLLKLIQSENLSYQELIS
jgi:hypothetical protein